MTAVNSTGTLVFQRLNQKYLFAYKNFLHNQVMEASNKAGTVKQEFSWFCMNVTLTDALGDSETRFCENMAAVRRFVKSYPKPAEMQARVTIGSEKINNLRTIYTGTASGLISR